MSIVSSSQDIKKITFNNGLVALSIEMGPHSHRANSIVTLRLSQADDRVEMEFWALCEVHAMMGQFIENCNRTFLNYRA